MTAFAISFSAWCCVSAAFVVLMIYRGYLAQHETEQLYLAHELPAVPHRHVDDTVRRIASIGRACTVLGAVSVVITLAVVGIRFSQMALAANII